MLPNISRSKGNRTDSCGFSHIYWRHLNGKLHFFVQYCQSHFPHDFWRKIFILLYSINWRSFIVWLSLLREILGNMCIVIVCWPGCDVMNFEVNFIFLFKPFFLHDQKVMTETWKILRKKRAFNMSIFITFKGLLMKQVTQFCLEGECPTLISVMSNSINQSNINFASLFPSLNGCSYIKIFKSSNNFTNIFKKNLWKSTNGCFYFMATYNICITYKQLVM